MAVIKVRDNQGEIKQFRIEGDTPTVAEQQRIGQALNPSPRIGQLRSLEDIVGQQSNKDTENFDYKTGGDSSLRALLSFGESADDQEAILTKLVGADGFTRDNDGRLALTPEGQRRRGMDTIEKNLVIEDEGFSFGDIADLTGFVPETVGAVGGTILGLPLGLFGASAGAGLGAAVGQTIEEGVESLLGVQKQSAEEVAKDVATEAALAAGFEFAGGLIFKAGRAIIGGGTQLARKVGTPTAKLEGEKLARAERLLDKDYIPSADAIGAPPMVGYRQKFSENVLRDDTRLRRNLNAAFNDKDELIDNLIGAQADAAAVGFGNLSKQQFNTLKKAQTDASAASIKAVNQSIDYIQKNVDMDISINERLLDRVNQAFISFENKTASDFARVDDLLKQVELPGGVSAQTARVVPTSEIKASLDTVIEEAGGIAATTPRTQAAVDAIRGLDEFSSFRQVVLARKQLNDAMMSENALFRRVLDDSLMSLRQSLDRAVDGTNLTKLEGLKGLSKEAKEKIKEASELRLDAMNSYKVGRKTFEDLERFGVIRSIRDLGVDNPNVKFEIDTFFNRVLKSDQPERLKQLLTTVGDQAEPLRQELSRSFLENAIQKTGIAKSGDLTTGKFSGTLFNTQIQKLGNDVGRVLFKEQWNELKNLGEIIARSGTEKLDKEVLDQIISRGTAQNKPLVDSLKELAEAKEAFAQTKGISLVNRMNQGILDPAEAVQLVATPGRVSLAEAKKIKKFFENDPTSFQNLKQFVVEDILSAVDGNVFSSTQTAQALLKHINRFDPKVLKEILGENEFIALKEFGKDLEFLSDVSREGTIAAASYTANPIKKYKEIIQAKLFNIIGSNPEIARKYVQAAKAGRDNPEGVNDRVADAVNAAADKYFTRGQIATSLPRQIIAQSVGPQPEDTRVTNENLETFNIQPAATSSIISNIDVTDPGIGDALGLSPADQAIAGRQIRGSLNQGRITP
jgi:hypothetical protein